MTHQPPPGAVPRQTPYPGPVGPPLLRDLAGHLHNPVPIVVAAAGLTLLALAFFLPQASYTYQGDADPLRDLVYFPDRDQQLYLSLADHPALVPLVLTVAASIALANSRRWLLFGRLGAYGLGVVAAAAAVGGSFTWQRQLRALLDSSQRYQESIGDEAGPVDKKLLDKIDIGFDAGLWILIAGITALVVAVILIRGTHRPVAAHWPGPAAPLRHPAAPVPRPAPAPAPPLPAAPATPEPAAAERPIDVHDDPPSLSIYKPPKAEK